MALVDRRRWYRFLPPDSVGAHHDTSRASGGADLSWRGTPRRELAVGCLGEQNGLVLGDDGMGGGPGRRINEGSEEVS